MIKNKRRKLFQQSLEKLLAKYERRMQALAEEAFKVRQALDNLRATNTKLEGITPEILEAADIAAKELANQVIKQGE